MYFYFYHFLHLVANLVFHIWSIIFQPYEFFVIRKRYYFDTEKLTCMCSIDFRNFTKFQLLSYHVCGQSCVLFGLFVPSRALLVQNASLLKPLYLGKHYAYRKRMVKHISKLHVSDKENVNDSQISNLVPPVNCQASHWRKGS